MSDNRRGGVRRDSVGEPMDERVAMGYSDSWVVELEENEDPNSVAQRHGFINLGQVSQSIHHERSK